jgi:hypothetical protein
MEKVVEDLMLVLDAILNLMQHMLTDVKLFIMDELCVQIVYQML